MKKHVICSNVKSFLTAEKKKLERSRYAIWDHMPSSILDLRTEYSAIEALSYHVLRTGDKNFIGEFEAFFQED